MVVAWRWDMMGGNQPPASLVNTLVTHANMKVLTPLFGDRRGLMPPQLRLMKKNKKNSYQEAVEGIARKPSFTFWSWWWWPDAETWWESTYSIIGDKVIIEKSHGGKFLWNRNSDLGWSRAGWHYWKKEDIWAYYEQLLRLVFSCFHGPKKRRKKM